MCHIRSPLIHPQTGIPFLVSVMPLLMERHLTPVKVERKNASDAKSIFIYTPFQKKQSKESDPPVWVQEEDVCLDDGFGGISLYFYVAFSVFLLLTLSLSLSPSFLSLSLSPSPGRGPSYPR